MPGRDVADLVTDDEGQRLGVARLAADLEEVAVDHHVAAKAVTAGEGVDLAIAQHDVRVRHLGEAETLRSLDDQPIALGELGGRHLDAVRALPAVVQPAGQEQDERRGEHRQPQQAGLAGQHHRARDQIQHHAGRDDQDEQSDLPRVAPGLLAEAGRRVRVVVGRRIDDGHDGPWSPDIRLCPVGFWATSVSAAVLGTFFINPWSPGQRHDGGGRSTVRTDS